MTTYVFTKDAGDISVSQDLTLNTGETITSIQQGTPTPVTSPVPAVVITSGTATPLAMTIKGGVAGMTYGVPLTITTNQRVFTATVAVVVKSNSVDPYRNEDPESYQDLVGDMCAGKTALATTYFQFANDFDPSSGYVTWDLMDDQGIVYASGNAFEYKIQATGVNNIVIARSVINVPADIPPSLDNPYQLRYCLRCNDVVAYSYENITVHGFPDIQVGAQDSIEMKGDIATLSLVTEKLYKNYVLEIYQNNVMVASLACSNAERINNGYFVAGAVDTSALAVTLIPYQIIWKFWNTPAQTFRESAALWIVNSSLIQAIEDVKSKINKARQTLYGTFDSQFPSTEVMKWLRRGGDAFNGAYGLFTNFTFTNAMGAVRELWLIQSEILALQAQFLMEAEKSFSFQGQAITLDVDRTQYLDNMESKLQWQRCSNKSIFMIIFYFAHL